MSVLLAKLPSFAIEERDERGARAGEPLLVADEVAGGVRDAVSMSNGPVRLRRPARGIRAVLRQLVPTRGGVSFGPPKSKRSRRTIALDAETVAALREHREAQLLERAFADDAYTDSDLVFCDELGGTIYPQRLGETFLRQRKAAGLTTGTLHIQRHTHATLALTNGVPVHVVAARIGDRPETVLRVYAHLLPQSDVQAAEQVAGLLATVGEKVSSHG
jgi:integrase